MTALRTRLSIWTIVLIMALTGTVAWLVATRTGDDSGSRGLSVELLSHNKNDGKDACPNDGNAGKGNDNKGPNGGCRPHPPTGGYGNVGP